MISLPHIVWLTATAAFVFGCARMAHASPRGHHIFRIALFVGVLINEGAWFAYRHFTVGMRLAENLPLHLCDLSVFALLAGLATDRRFFADWAYFPGVVGALLAVVFPAVSETGAIRPIAEARYFITHIALVGAGFYLTFGCRYYPETKAVLRVYAAILAYAIVVTPLNLYLDTNYFYTLSPPTEVHFVHAFPHWFFLGAVSATFLAAFGLLHLPFRWKRPSR
ncbi:MAG: TIGR02206 family membrane protein [Candidatus Latescibacterota bacterium]